MKKTFTINELLLYIYNELNPALTKRIRDEIKKNPKLAEQVNSLQAAAAALDNLLKAPSKKSVDKIMRYSAKTKKSKRSN